MANEGGGNNDAFSTLWAAVVAFIVWCLRFIITRYFSRKDEARKRREAEELKRLLEQDIRERQVGKSHKVGK